jgi:hypothetical protein
VRLLGVFLRDADAGREIQTELAARAGIALGAVGAGRRRLVELGILQRLGEREWGLGDREDGLRHFAEGYAAVVRPKLRPATYVPIAPGIRGPIERRLEVHDRTGDWLVGGELAAGRLTGLLETEHATLHVPAGRDRRELATELGIVPDPGGPITMLDRYGVGDEHAGEDDATLPLVDPLLVWAECLVTADERVLQAARVLHDDHLRKPPTHAEGSDG